MRALFAALALAALATLAASATKAAPAIATVGAAAVPKPAAVTRVQGWFDVPSDYHTKYADVPADCVLPSSVSLVGEPKCPKWNTKFSACGVYSQSRRGCWRFCYTLLFARGLQLRSCFARPTPAETARLYGRCRIQCWRAHAGINAVVRKKGGVAHALIRVREVNRTAVAAAHKLFRPSKRVLKLSLPPLCIPNPACKKPSPPSPCPTLLCRLGRTQSREQATAQNCWWCAWTGAACHPDCDRFGYPRWGFEI